MTRAEIERALSEFEQCGLESFVAAILRDCPAPQWFYWLSDEREQGWSSGIDIPESDTVTKLGTTTADSTVETVIASINARLQEMQKS